MIAALLKNAKDKRTMHDVVAEEFVNLCARITVKANILAERLDNGAGKAVIRSFDEMMDRKNGKNS